MAKALIATSFLIFFFGSLVGIPVVVAFLLCGVTMTVGIGMYLRKWSNGSG